MKYGRIEHGALVCVNYIMAALRAASAWRRS
jgi:hypothetical protein